MHDDILNSGPFQVGEVTASQFSSTHNRGRRCANNRVTHKMPMQKESEALNYLMPLQHVQSQKHVHGLFLKYRERTRQEISFNLNLS